MQRISAVLFAFGWLSAASLAAGGQPAFPPTFSEHIAPIVYERCASCHRPDGGAPFSLISYDDVRRRATQIARATASRYMPPWKPEPGFGQFQDERRLTDTQIALFQEWARAGAPEGDPAAVPARPRFAPGWQLGEPDLVITLPEYTLRPDGLDLFRNFVVPIAVTSTRFVRGFEFRAGSATVHHANIRLDRTPASRRLDNGDPAPGYEGLILNSAHYPDGHFLGWTPGQVAPFAPKGLAWRVEPGADFVVQLHMRPSGREERLQPQIGLFFTDDPPESTPVMVRLGRQNIDIGPGDAAYRSADVYTMPVDAQVHAVQPHSHYRARNVKAWAELPDGSTRPIIHIARWDFAWQDVYRVAQPFWLPAGTRLLTEYVFDNSAGNPRNPEVPPSRVRWGFKSSDEMGDVWIQVVARNDADRARLAADYRRKSIAEDVVGYEMQLGVKPDDVALHNDAAVLYLELGRTQDAVRHFDAVVRAQPASAVAWYNLGTSLEAGGAFADAAVRYSEAVALDPGYAIAHVNLGNMRLRQGRLPDATTHYMEAVRLAPEDVVARNNLARALAIGGRYVEAVTEFRSAIRFRPDWAPGLLGLAWVLSTCPDATVRNGTEAIDLASRAVRLTPGSDPNALDVLAAAYASAGRFDEAVATARRAVAVATEVSLPEHAADMRKRLELYLQRRSFVDSEVLN